MSERRVYVVGGGLAGMTVAYSLAKHGVPVTVLEADDRLGGKAGADWDAQLGLYLDHGFHIFPPWYVNTRALLKDLGLADDLVDTNKQHTITRPDASGRGGRWYTSYAVKSPLQALHNLRNSPLRWSDGLLASYFLIDLAAEPLDRDRFLDRVSVNGFFRSRFYRNEEVANFQHFLGLQASSIPGDALSAKTFQTVVRGFMAYRKQLVGLLRGDLQTHFIEPFQRRLEQRGVRIHLRKRVQALQFQDRRISDLLVGTRATPEAAAQGAGGGPTPGRSPSEGVPLGTLVEEQPSPDDIFVLATPPDVTLGFVNDELYALEHVGDEERKPLAGLHYLTNEPMAALHVFFKRKLDRIPEWHTGLHGSRYSLSFIDISKHWPKLESRGQTVLSVIAANFKELCSVSPRAQEKYLLDELLAYLRHDENGNQQITADDIAHVRLSSHVDARLFLNTTSAWHFRPDGRTRIDNLFVAGDYCRSQADLTTMESAVESALTTARLVLAELGKGGDLVKLETFKPPSAFLLWSLRWGLWLPIRALVVWHWLLRALGARSLGRAKKSAVR